MIGQLSGVLLEKTPPRIVLDVQGVGYELDVPMSTFYPLPAIGERVRLYTHLAVRDDGHFLYGFLRDDERVAFRLLLKVSGVGARIALAVLSGLSVGELHQAIALQESGRLMKIPGIGKKTAERLLLELRDKLGALPAPGGTVLPAGGLPASGPPDARSDMLNALLALGYNEREAVGALKAVPDDTPVAEGIRLALRQLSRA